MHTEENGQIHSGWHKNTQMGSHIHTIQIWFCLPEVLWKTQKPAGCINAGNILTS
jgi:hypothetical protein